MQVPKVIRPGVVSLPPMYSWPLPLKRAILTLTTVACLGVYVLLVGGLLGTVLLLLELTLD